MSSEIQCVRARDMIGDGLIIIDKPCGHVSHGITAFVKKLLGAKRAGHAGTLDPEVSGVLPVAIGKATKLIGYIAGKRKKYVGIIKFKDRSITNERIKELFKEFTGVITQTPPKESAVRKVPRKRTVYYFDFLERKDNLVLFAVEVEAGTYIRTLCEDIGKKCGGARMEELRRIAVGRITENEAVTLQDLIDAIWLYKKGKPETLLELIKKPEDYIDARKIIVRESAVKSIKSGAQLMAPGVKDVEKGIEKNEIVALYSESGMFVGMGKALFGRDEILSRRRGIVVRIERMHL
ncbi:MAG: RNA-guided pseudouridylation complex pseudouridine synthase subunit Cbf5 [Candidatus Bilamarchaeaceae archaeon]